jgi:FixJ family two-component response regulator
MNKNISKPIQPQELLGAIEKEISASAAAQDKASEKTVSNRERII